MNAYKKYALKLNFKIEELFTSESSTAVIITGKNCYNSFKNESGRVCVQRVPPTERSGRRQTSYVSVAVLPVLKQTEYNLNLSEVEITTQRGHGSGGQNINKVSSAVRAVHIPTGISVFINGRDQYHNKKRALDILASKLFNQKKTAEKSDYNSMRRSQFDGFGRGGGKIRTINFIDSRTTDHRTGVKAKTENVMKGGFEIFY